MTHWFRSSSPLRVLLLDDNPADRRLLTRLLRQTWPQAAIHEVTEASAFDAALQQGDFDIVLTDYRLRWSDGLRVLEQVQALYPHKPVVLVTDSGSEEVAARALRLGAAGYVLKKRPHLQRLPEVIRQALDSVTARALARYLHALYQHLPQGVFHADISGHLRLLNPTALRLLGLESPQQAIGRPLVEFIHPQERNAVQQAIRTAAAQPQRLVVRLALSPPRWVRLTLWRNHDVGPTPVLYGMLEDITESVRRDSFREMWLQTAQRVLGTPHPSQGLERLLHHLLEWLNAQVGVLYWYDATTDRFQLGPRAARTPQSLHTIPFQLPGDHALLGQVLHQGETLLLNQDDATRQGLPLPPSYRHLIALPLHREQEAIGVVLLIREQDPPFSEEDLLQTLSFLGLLVALVGEMHHREAMAVEQARLQASTERLRRLHQAATMLAAARTPEMVWEALDEALAGLNWLYIAFRLVDDTLRVVASNLPTPQREALERSLSQPFFSLSLPLHLWPQAAQALRRGEAHWGTTHQEDMQRLARHLRLPQEWPTWLGMEAEHTSMTLLPLQVEHRPWGLLVIWGQELAAEETPLLETLAHQVEISLEKAQLLAQTERRAQRMSILVRLSAQLAGAKTPEEVHQLLVNGLHTELGYRYVRLYRVDPATGDRVLASQRIDPELRTTVPLRLKAGYGLSHQAVVEKRQIYAPDVRQMRHYVPGLGQGAEVETPILIGQQVYGVLIVAHPDSHAFEKEDLEVLQAIAQMAAVALEKIHLLTTERRRANAQETLRTVLLDLTSELQPERLYQAIVHRAHALAEAKGVALWLPHPVSNAWQRVAVTGSLPPTAEQPTLPQPRLQEAALLGDPLGAPLRLGPYHWWIPLSLRGHIVGWLEYFWEQTVWNPLEYNVALGRSLMLFGAQAAVTLENARLFHTTQKQAHTAETLYRAARRIAQSTLDPETVYQTIYQAVHETIGGDAFVLARYEANTRTLTMAFGMDGDQRLPPRQIPLTESLLGYVISTGKSVLVRNLSEEQNGLPFHFQRLGRFMHAVMAVPLPGPQGPLGAISMQSLQPYAFTTEDLRLLETLASHAAVALENATLFERTHQMAITDELTGLYNRRQLFNLGAREVQRARRFGRPLSAAMMDLDDFKRVNDTYGHAVGDEVLRQWAQRMAQSIRDIDVLGRYGGEEFALVLPETTLEAAVQLAERLRLTVAQEPFHTSAGPIHLTMSIGVTEWHPSVPSITALLREADQGLYLAKQKGKNRTGWKRPDESQPHLWEPNA